MNLRILTLAFSMLAGNAQAYFHALTTEERIWAATVIAVIKVVKQPEDQQFRSSAFTEVSVVESILGTKAGERIKVWNAFFIDEDGGKYLIAGRDPSLEEGKTYFIYLCPDKSGRLVTVQSSLDSLEVTRDKVEKEGEEGSEPLAQKIKRTRELLAKIKKAQQDRADQSVTAPESKLEGGSKPQPEAEVRSQ